MKKKTWKRLTFAVPGEMLKWLETTSRQRILCIADIIRQIIAGDITPMNGEIRRMAAKHHNLPSLPERPVGLPAIQPGSASFENKPEKEKG